MKDNSMPDFVEAAIYSISKGPLAGKYVASCAQDKCGYFGEACSTYRLQVRLTTSIVFIEEIFNRPGAPSRSYEPRRVFFKLMVVGLTNHRTMDIGSGA